mgnify:CR=1 FL=1|jgi:hypothetical protein
MSIFQPPPVQFSSTAPKYLDSPRSAKHTTPRKERKNRRNNMRASKRELAGEQNKVLKANMNENIISISTFLNVLDIPPQSIPNEHEWHRRMNEISAE